MPMKHFPILGLKSELEVAEDVVVQQLVTPNGQEAMVGFSPKRLEEAVP